MLGFRQRCPKERRCRRCFTNATALLFVLLFQQPLDFCKESRTVFVRKDGKHRIVSEGAHLCFIQLVFFSREVGTVELILGLALDLGFQNCGHGLRISCFGNMKNADFIKAHACGVENRELIAQILLFNIAEVNIQNRRTDFREFCLGILQGDGGKSVLSQIDYRNIVLIFHRRRLIPA